VGEVAVVVTRYFGGTKLGKGGLCRAYSGMVVLALDSLALTEKFVAVRLRVEVAYEHVSALKRLAEAREAKALDETYGAAASLLFELPEEDELPFARAITDQTRGSARIEREEA
jgi:putative IMPACT (imprinted ancient) family translation regulator